MPTESAASSTASDAGADDAFDGVANEYWAPDPGGDGTGEWVEARFAEPTRLLDILVSSGVSGVQEEFLTEARPRELDLVMTTSEGAAVTERITLTDSAKPQSFSLGVSDVVSLRVVVVSSFGYEAGRKVAIAELEFFSRK